MQDDNFEQEQEEIVEVLSTDPTPPERKSYEDYVREAEAKAEAELGDEGESKEQDESHSEVQIPEKFKGKSVEDIIASYQHLESEYGRRNQEIGTLRKLTDQLLELDEPKKKEKPKVTVDSLLENPEDVINSSIDSNPRLKAIEDKLHKESLKEEKQAFESKHPDWEATMRTAEFAEWIGGSAVRQRMLLEADQNFDYALGSELFDMYELVRGSAVKEAKKERDTKARQSAKSGVTESGGASGEGGGKKKKYRRADLIQLKVSNPAEYDRRYESEFKPAYMEGRVI
jgi:hypothetical protein